MADKDEKSQGKSKAEQAREAQGTPVPGGVQVSPASDVPRRTQDVEGNPVDEELDPKTGKPKKG
jgi:hypothetical protein